MTSISGEYGTLSNAQYQVVAKIRRGVEVRAEEIHPDTLQALIRKNIVDCKAPTSILVLKNG